LVSLLELFDRELARRGFDVYAVTWAEPGMRKFMEIGGIKVLSYPYTYTSRSTLRHIVDYSEIAPPIKQVDADVYISIDCLVETYIAQKVISNRKHVIWVQDPFDWEDYKLLGSVDPNYRISPLKFWATTKLYERAYRRADLVLS